MKILLLEDDPVLSDIYMDFLQEKFEVKHTFSSRIALEFIEEDSYDLYLFDVNVADLSGIELLKKLRRFNDMTPAIFITAYQDTQVLTDAFGAGASDFIRKPFDLEELLARIENIKKQLGIETLIVIEDGITFNAQRHQINVADEIFHLSNKESSLLAYLYKNRNRAIDGQELLQNLWAYEEMPSIDTIRTYIKTIRRIIGKDHIVNIRGVGYRYE